MQENELLYLYKKYEYNFIESILYFKYRRLMFYILKITLHKINYKFIDYNDYESYQYLSFLNSLKKYNITSNKKFQNFVLQRWQWAIFNIYKQKNNHKNKIINNYTPIKNDNHAFYDYNYSKIIKNDFILWLNKQIEQMENKNKNIIKLILKSKSRNEIQNILSLKRNQVDYLYYQSIEKIKKIIFY